MDQVSRRHADREQFNGQREARIDPVATATTHISVWSH
jgi:hypothetical protein